MAEGTDIANPEEAFAVAEWLKANKSDSRFPAVRAKLVNYIDNNPDYQHPDGPPNPPTAFGAKVAAGANGPLPQQPPEGFSGPLQGMMSGPKQAPPPEQSDPQTPGYSPANYPPPSLGEETPPTPKPPLGISSGLNQKLNIFNPEARQAFWDTVGPPATQAVNGFVGGLDLAAHMGLNALGQIPAGVGGAIAMYGPGGTDAGAKFIQDWSTHAPPLTPQGKEIAGGIAKGVSVVDNTAKEAAWTMARGNPAWAALAYSAMNFLPAEEGFVTAGSLRNSTMNLVDKVKDFYNERGITLGSKNMEDQMTRYALENNADVPTSRGKALAPVVDAVRQEQTKQLGMIADQEAAIQASQGKVSVRGIQDAIAESDQKVAHDFEPSKWQTKPPKIDPETGEPLPQNLTGYQWGRAEVQKLIDRANAQKNSKSPGNYVPLSDLNALRTKISNMDSGPAAVLHDALDNFINGQIEDGFVRGDKNLTSGFADLKALRDKYARDFKEGSVVYRMATEKDASLEEFSQMIYNLSDNGYKVQSTKVVNQLAKIFGHDSPELDSMRLEFLGKALEPLRGDNPDWAGFRKLYETSIYKNNSLVTALSPYMERDLEQLYRLSKASAKVGPQRGIIWQNVRRNLIREAAGNSLARNNTKLNVYNTALNFVLAKSSKDVKNGLLKELTGVDRVKPLFRPGSPTTQMLWASAISQETSDQRYNK